MEHNTGAATAKPQTDHLGNHFESIVQMCEYWGITYAQYTGRLKAGYSLKDTLTNRNAAYQSRHSADDRKGKTYMQKNGYHATIIAYRNSLDCDVQFDDADKTIHKNVKYNDVKYGHVGFAKRRDKSIAVGDRYLQKNGTYVTVSEIVNPHDVTVIFDDGTVVAHKYSGDVKNGLVRNPNNYKNKFMNMTCSCYCGVSCKIIDCNNDKDVTVQFEDGTILSHVRNSIRSKTGFCHPELNRRNKERNFHGYRVEGCPVKIEGQTFYRAVKIDTGEEVFMTPQMMIVAERES
jgi:hypothetical protein